MTKEAIEHIIQKIKEEAGDFERQHSLEDDLHVAFIRHVAQQNTELGDLANLVLTTSNISFPRHRA